MPRTGDGAAGVPAPPGALPSRVPTTPSQPCAKTVSLTVLPGEPGPRKVKKSRVSVWRAAVLILVHVAMGVHLLQWWLSGRDDGVRRTLAPIEPSESMYTIQNGQLNPGVIFFGLAILSTLLLGRWVCGWGCHIIALQDLCGWMMKKIGIHPKPFRTRLVLWGTTVMAFYMFAWPAVHRWVLTPWLGESLPLYFGRSAPWPGLEQHHQVEDLWATMPSIAVAIPFVLVSCFVVVYFLGAKGYCTYGCPYGALFAPADRLAPMRIVVSDDCEQCGHCTAVCSSNVRVHEEVRDYGMVVSPGCMKCMDCVSVCPKGALSFGLGKPALLAGRKKAPEPAAHPRGTPKYDLSLGQDALLFLVWVAVLFGIRGTMTWVPLLFASALAALTTFGVAKCWQLLTEPNVRAAHVQLKLKGRLKPAGALAVVVTLGLLAASAWSGYVRMYLRDTAAVDHFRMMQAVNTHGRNLLDPAYAPTPEIRALAESVRRKLTRSDAPSAGGLGWAISPMDLVRLSQAHLALKDAGDPKASIARLREAEATHALLLRRETPQNLQIASEYLQIIATRQFLETGKNDPAELHAAFDAIIAAHAQPGAACLAKASLLGMEQKMEDSKVWIRRAFYADQATDVATQVEASRMLFLSGERDEALDRLARAIAARPHSADLLIGRAVLRMPPADDKPALAEPDLRKALELSPRSPVAMSLLAQCLQAMGRADEARTLMDQARALAPQTPTIREEPDAPNAN